MSTQSTADATVRGMRNAIAPKIWVKDAPRGIRLCAGEMVTCENGHPFGRVIRDCEAGQGNWLPAIDWLQYIPSDGGSMLCTACGARWVFMIYKVNDPTQKRARIHVGSEWRPPLDELDMKHVGAQEVVNHE